MAFTDHCDIFASIHEKSFNNVVLQLQRQRPSLFNYGTTTFADHPETKQQPVRLRLSDKGFDPAKIEKWPAPALVISIETQAALNLQDTEPAPGRPSSSKSEKEQAKAAPKKAERKK